MKDSGCGKVIAVRKTNEPIRRINLLMRNQYDRRPQSKTLPVWRLVSIARDVRRLGRVSIDGRTSRHISRNRLLDGNPDLDGAPDLTC